MKSKEEIARDKRYLGFRLEALNHLRNALQFDDHKLDAILWLEKEEVAVLCWRGGSKKRVNCGSDSIQAMILDIMRHGIFEEG